MQCDLFGCLVVWLFKHKHKRKQPIPLSGCWLLADRSVVVCRGRVVFKSIVYLYINIT